MPRFKVLLTDYAWPDVEVERAVLAEVGAELVVSPSQDVETLAALASDVDAVLTCWAQVPQAVMAASPGCRIICRLGIGLDNIDLPAATARGIIVTNVPDYCTEEVAQHTLALLLALSRNIAIYHADSKAGRYDRSAGSLLRRLSGQSLGIIGLGNIGSRVAQLAAGLGLAVLAASRTPRQSPGAEMCELPELLQRSDYVSLHAPLNDDTRQLINAPALEQMKPSAFLINTSRGGLVDHAALAAALESGRLAGAALDVQDPEPPNLEEPPYNHPRVIVTPHAAFASEESLTELRTRAAQQVADFLVGKHPENIVNPEVLK